MRAYWLVEPHLTETDLSRYYDSGHNGCVTVPDTPHYRAISESGWDNTPRFGDDTIHLLPVDLNCQLYRYERDLALFSEMLGRSKEANAWRTKAQTRRTLINQYSWDEASGFYWDYDLQAQDRLRSTPRSLASFVPLWAEVANQTQAARMRQHLPVFEYEHGLVACEKDNHWWFSNRTHTSSDNWALLG